MTDDQIKRIYLETTGFDLDESEAALLDFARAALATQPSVAGEGGERERVCEAIAESLGDAYDCMRVWSAWSYGTMGPDDFRLVSEDDGRISEIADAVLAALAHKAAPIAVPQAVLDALRFYAHGHHFNIDADHQQFDTVSGEPQNWLMSEQEDDCTTIEDGSVAKAVLLGWLPRFEEPTQPIEGEVFMTNAATDFCAKNCARMCQNSTHGVCDGPPAPIASTEEAPPIPMLLFCPQCGTQHVDAPETFTPTGRCECAGPDECEVCEQNRVAYKETWQNPPHRSHKCHACGCIWRPADVATTGVETIATVGKLDNWDGPPSVASHPAAAQPVAQTAECSVASDCKWPSCRRDCVIRTDAAAQPSMEVLETWQPIATAPRTGRTLLLGYPNALGKWRTVRGQWMSEAYIAENWEEPDDAEAGWYETSAEADDVPNCWPITPTHWMPLPAAPETKP